MWIVFASTAALIILLFGVFAFQWWTWRPVVTRRVLVHLDAGQSLSGVVMSRRGRLLVLADVSVHASASVSSAADGTVVIERDRVVWMQVIS